MKEVEDKKGEQLARILPCSNKLCITSRQFIHLFWPQVYWYILGK